MIPEPDTAPDAKPLAEPLARLLQASPDTAFDYLEFRRLMAGNAAALAAERASEADRARITGCLDAMEQAHALDDPAQEAAMDAEFHLAIYQAAHNQVLTHVMSGIFAMLRGGVFYDRDELYRRRGVRDGFLRQHQAICRAIVDRDPALARKTAQSHIDSIEAALREAKYADARRDVALRRLSGSGLTARPRDE